MIIRKTELYLTDEDRQLMNRTVRRDCSQRERLRAHILAALDGGIPEKTSG
ncbi:hypothetical protein [Nitrosomonas communis]|uniref:hypothetical protein n=1 Tax=Nitrosomonas communis TaxID=44574 RepID=UPI0014818F72|nr:hypothetical protein [Nitrosomonas communis]